jgi:hypothetical protein
MANHGLDFEGFVKCTRQICNLTDGHPQLCLLAGWNGWGWDSEYPSCDLPGEEFGGREGLYKLHEGGRAWRCYVTMIHNFDDAYADSQAFDPAVLCRDQDGQLHRATWWAGGPSFILCPYKFYKSGAMPKTIDTLIAQGLERQIFSDVFTIVPYRESFDRGDPRDAMTNIVLGKFKVLEYLADHNIYMNSEGFNYEMLGRTIEGHNGFPQGLSDDPDRPPLAAFITHGLLTKKFWRPNDEGRFLGVETEVENPWKLDDVYLWAMLMSYYAEKPMRDFQAVPGGYRARYGDDTLVRWEKAAGVRVELGGRLIADGRSVLLPKPDRPNVFRAYTRAGEPMIYPKPDTWTTLDALTVMKLTAEEPPAPVPNDGLAMFDGANVVLDLPKGVPFKLVYGKENVARERKFEPFPAKNLTYPLDEVLERSAPERPRWIRKVTRKEVEKAKGWDGKTSRYGVGCSACWLTLEEARKHAASIVSRKVAWVVRQKYVNRSREYEKACGADTGKLGYDNWQLGYTTARRLLTVETISQREGTEWYSEKVRHGMGPDRREAWKAFVATPLTAKDLHEIYIQAAKDRLEECRKALADAKNEERPRLELNVKVYARLLAEEPRRDAVDLTFDMF